MIHNKYVILGKILGTDVIIICFFNPLCIFTCILTVVLSYMVSLSCTYMHTASQYHSTLLSCNIYEYWSNFTLVHYWFFTGFLKLPLNLFISRFFARFHWFFNLSMPFSVLGKYARGELSMTDIEVDADVYNFCYSVVNQSFPAQERRNT